MVHYLWLTQLIHLEFINVLFLIMYFLFRLSIIIYYLSLKQIFITEGTVSFYSDHCEFRASHSQDILVNDRIIFGLYLLEFHKDIN